MRNRDKQTGRRKSLIHFVAECKDCEWNCSDYRIGQKKASEHARKTGHVVHAELGYVTVYGVVKS